MASRGKKTWLLVVALLLCVMAGLWYAFLPSRESETAASVVPGNDVKSAPFVSSAETEEQGGLMSAAAVAAVLREHAQAGHVVFLNFQMDGEGARLVTARGAQGRASVAWTSGLRRGVLVYELRDRSGSVLAEGEVEDPLNRRLEYESQGGGISSTWVSLESSELMLRIPGIPSPASIEFFRGAPEDPARKVSLGRIQLQ